MLCVGIRGARVVAYYATLNRCRCASFACSWLSRSGRRSAGARCCSRTRAATPRVTDGFNQTLEGKKGRESAHGRARPICQSHCLIGCASGVNCRAQNLKVATRAAVVLIAFSNPKVITVLNLLRLLLGVKVRCLHEGRCSRGLTGWA